MSLPGFKKKLTIRTCQDNKGKLTVLEKPSFEVMLNPSSFKHEHSISYAEACPPPGQSGAEPKFRSVPAETVNFELMIDGTGVVNLPVPGLGSPDVATQIKDLKAIVYEYDGKKHEPNVVQLLWGEYKFYGRLTSMGVEYTLFKPSGAPLRAKVQLAFKSYMTMREEVLRSRKSSPDLSHRVQVRAGDTLPLLCYDIYKDSSYYLEVARHNDIEAFRALKPGSWLSFPPLRAP